MALVFYCLIFIPFFHRYQLFPNCIKNFIFPSVLSKNSKLDILILKLIVINIKDKVPLIIDRSDSQLQTYRISLLILYEFFVFFLTAQFYVFVGGFDCYLSLVAELSCSFRKASNHLEVKEVDGFSRYSLFTLIERKTYVVWDPTCLTDQLVDDVVTDCTVFKSNNINDASIWNCII